MQVYTWIRYSSGLKMNKYPEGAIFQKGPAVPHAADGGLWLLDLGELCGLYPTGILDTLRVSYGPACATHNGCHLAEGRPVSIVTVAGSRKMFPLGVPFYTYKEVEEHEAGEASNIN